MGSMSQIGASLRDSSAFFKDRKKRVFYFSLKYCFGMIRVLVLGQETKMRDKISNI